MAFYLIWPAAVCSLPDTASFRNPSH